MKLPVVATTAAGTGRETLWRHFTDLIVDYALAAGEEVPVDVGRLIVGDNAFARRLPGLAVLPFGGATTAAVDDATRPCDRLGLPRPCVFADVWPADGSTLTWTRREGRLLRLQAAKSRPATPKDMLILPGRAAREAFEVWCAERFVDDPSAALLPRHSDDPQYESVVALRGRQAIGAAALQSRGRMGLVCDVFVRPEERSSELADVLVGRMIELAARSQLTDVYAMTLDDETARVYGDCGFVDAMTFVVLAPSPGAASKGVG